MNQQIQQLLYECVQDPDALVRQRKLQRLIQALESLDAISSNDVANGSDVEGESVSDALNWLLSNTGVSIKNNLRATRVPTSTDDSSSGYTATATQASRWYWPDTGFEWIMQDDTNGNAVWGAVVGNPNP